MKCSRLLLAGLLVALSAGSCVKHAGPDHASGPDSLYSYEAIRDLSYSDPALALQRLDTAALLQAISPFYADYLRADILYSPLQQDDEAYRYALRAYGQTDSTTADEVRRMVILELLVRIAVIREDYLTGIRYASEGLRIAVAEGDLRAEANFLCRLGSCMLRTGQREAGYRNLQLGIASMEQSRSSDCLATLSLAYGELMCALSDDGRYDEAIRVGRKRESCLQRMADSPHQFPPGETDRQRAYLYAKMAHYLAADGCGEEAGQYAQRFRTTDFSRTPDGLMQLVEYYEASGNDAGLIGLYGGADYPDVADTLTENVVYYMRKKAGALARLGNFPEACRLLMRADGICDTVHNLALAEKAMSLCPGV